MGQVKIVCSAAGFDAIRSVSVTLTAGGWSASAPYMQTVRAVGITENWIPDMPVLVSSGVVETDKAMRAALACVCMIESGAGVLTFVCHEDKPDVDLHVRIGGVL